MTERDWFAILKQELDTELTRPVTPGAEVDELIADIVAGRISAPIARRPMSSRRRWLAGGAAIIVLAGGATTAALWNRAKPANPQQGIACHGSTDLVGDAQVIPPAADPLDACAQLWLAGVLPDIEHGGPATDVAPPQFACIGVGGGLDVFPNLSDPPITCVDLGLTEADTNVSQDPLVVLQDHLTNEINLVCVDVDTAQRLAEAALVDVGFDDWTIIVRDNTKDCVKAGEDPDTKMIYLQSLPGQSTTT